MEKKKLRTVMVAVFLTVTAVTTTAVLWRKFKKDEYVTSKIPQ